MKRLIISLAILSTGTLTVACSSGTQDEAPLTVAALTGTEDFTVLVAGTEIGQMQVDHASGSTLIDYEYRNNGRGPTINEALTFDQAGLPTSWTIEGATTFGNKISEQFEMAGGEASWTDTTGTGQVSTSAAALYVAQEASPYSIWIYARALLADDDHAMPVLPGGTLRVEKIEDLSITGTDGDLAVSSYALSGIDLNPTYFLLDGDEKFVALMTPRFAVIRTGFEAEDERLRGLSSEYASKRFEAIQQSVAKTYDAPIRVENVRVFDPETQSLTDTVSVMVDGNRIGEILPVSAPSIEGEVVIDGNGGTLIAGMYEMHGHLGQNSALLNIAAGVTSVRDMGNGNDTLAELIGKIDSGRLAGPRITRSGFIEGKSPFSSNNGELVSTQEEAIAAVQRYANGDFYQIKIYNSMNPEWVPAMIAEARKHGLKVAGHVPAFSNADEMIAAGYDEMTHINQVMLGWVLDEGEDTRSLLRLTALRRLPGIEMTDANVVATITAMAEGNVAIDPTLAIHEALLRSRNGTVAPGLVDYVDHMPVGFQRGAKTAWSDIATPEDDTAYWAAFDKIIETVAEMRQAGITLVPGTDLGGSFTYHRELELYQQVGMTAPEILKWATYDMAAYLGQDDELGSIESGKLADFFLIPGDPTTDLKAIKTISMVVKNGVVYFPSEIYPEFGIQPFVPAPEVTLPE